MPVTKTAKRALRVSKRKTDQNKSLSSKLDIAIRQAKRDKTEKKAIEAIKLADRAAKKKFIHKNKAARIKAALSKLFKPQAKKTIKK
jgi:small subunit ribosomal protein S20